MRTCTGDGRSPMGQWNGTASVCSGNICDNTRAYNMSCMQNYS